MKADDGRDLVRIKLRAEFGIALPHLAKQLPTGGVEIVKMHGNRTDIKRQVHGTAAHGFRSMQGEHGGCAECGMTREWQFFLGGKDTYAHALGLLDLKRPSRDECGFREVELARDRLHALGGQRGSIHDHGQRIAGERRLCEDIDDEVIKLRHRHSISEMTALSISILDLTRTRLL